MVSLLTAIAMAQQPALEQLRDHLDGRITLSWLRLGERLVTATMDEDSSAFTDELLAAMADAAPAERRQRAFAMLGRWAELPCCGNEPAARQLRLQKALLPAIADQTLPPRRAAPRCRQSARAGDDGPGRTAAWQQRRAGSRVRAQVMQGAPGVPASPHAR